MEADKPDEPTAGDPEEQQPSVEGGDTGPDEAAGGRGKRPCTDKQLAALRVGRCKARERMLKINEMYDLFKTHDQRELIDAVRLLRERQVNANAAANAPPAPQETVEEEPDEPEQPEPEAAPPPVNLKMTHAAFAPPPPREEVPDAPRKRKGKGRFALRFDDSDASDDSSDNERVIVIKRGKRSRREEVLPEPVAPTQPEPRQGAYGQLESGFVQNVPSNVYNPFADVLRLRWS